MSTSMMLTVSEAADTLDRHYASILNLIHKGHLRAVKLGGRWMINQDEIERFLSEGNYRGEKQAEEC